jgi:hypothetical protein
MLQSLLSTYYRNIGHLAANNPVMKVPYAIWEPQQKAGKVIDTQRINKIWQKDSPRLWSDFLRLCGCIFLDFVESTFLFPIALCVARRSRSTLVFVTVKIAESSDAEVPQIPDDGLEVVRDSFMVDDPPNLLPQNELEAFDEEDVAVTFVKLQGFSLLCTNSARRLPNACSRNFFIVCELYSTLQSAMSIINISLAASRPTSSRCPFWQNVKPFSM